MEGNDSKKHEIFHAHWESLYRSLFNVTPPYVSNLFPIISTTSNKQVVKLDHYFPKKSEKNKSGDPIVKDMVRYHKFF